ncbi:phosphatidylserine/phosphatidylglycerophosphate/cardiolipin synthase family protein [Chitinophaga sp. Hz27]|uniref:phospholipase D-like domain-containing protein n=1 Tax=Chitinophaga sp. Hz27 TaxID=3347169 RepID=UPI0035E22B42
MKIFKVCLYILAITFLGCREGEAMYFEGGKVVPVHISFPSAVFTAPDVVGAGISSPLIMNRAISLIDATPAEAAIHMSAYGFDHKGIINALKRAANRGVHVFVLIDISREETQEQNQPVIRELQHAGANLVAKSFYNDASKSAINHNKFILFSKLVTDRDTAANIVFQTSHNFTEADTKKVQDAVVLQQEGLYKAYLNYWTDMESRAVSGMKNYQYKEYNDDVAGIRACFLPMRKNGAFTGDDFIIDILNDITDPANTTVRVGMSDWVNSRLNVAQKLHELLKKGAKIELVVKNKIDDSIIDEIAQMEKEGAYVKMLNLEDKSRPRQNIHSKFMMIDGEYQHQRVRMVVTGSHNFTQNALQNNCETELLLRDPGIYSAYEDNYKGLKNM